MTRAAWLLCLPILLVAARAEARGCHEVSEIVGKQRCQRFGGVWDVEGVTPWVLSLGPSIERFSEPGVTFAGTVTGPHTAGWPFAVRGADLGKWTSVSPTMRLSFFPVRVLYVGVEGQMGVMSELPETTVYPGPAPSARTAVHTIGFSSRSLGSVVGVSLPAWRFDFSAELFSGFRALSLDLDWNNLRGAYAAAGRCAPGSNNSTTCPSVDGGWTYTARLEPRAGVAFRVYPWVTLRALGGLDPLAHGWSATALVELHTRTADAFYRRQRAAGAE